MRSNRPSCIYAAFCIVVFLITGSQRAASYETEYEGGYPMPASAEAIFEE